MSSKIVFLGNCNNYSFNLALYLKSLGHDIVFYVDSSYHLHRPECKYSCISLPYPSWIVDISTDKISVTDWIFRTGKIKQILAVVRSSDFAFLNQQWIMIGYICQKPYITAFTGSDLDIHSSFKNALNLHFHGFAKKNLSRKAKSILSALIILLFVSRMRRSTRLALGYIKSAYGLIRHADLIIDSIRPRGQFIFGLCVNPSSYRLIPASPKSNELLILNMARVNWLLPPKPGTSHLDYKGTDILLEGFSQYIKRSSFKAKLLMPRKGFDVKPAVDLAHSLGISDHIEWFAELEPADFSNLIQIADITVDQLSSSIVSGAGLEAMAMGKPLIANERPEIFSQYLRAESAVFQASAPSDVFNHLLHLTDPWNREKASVASRDYVCQVYSISAVAQNCLKVLGSPS
jgi:glycosyltransferase involved in cell wall biosynthesis